MCSVPIDFYGIRAFGFLNAASLIPGPVVGRFGSLASDLKNGTRISAGAGLSFPIMAGSQLELTLAQPILQREGDVKQRLQFGLRVHKSF